MININTIYARAADLIDTDRPSEYTRGICELIAELDAVIDTPHDVRAKEVAIKLGISNTIASMIW